MVSGSLGNMSRVRVEVIGLLPKTLFSTVLGVRAGWTLPFISDNFTAQPIPLPGEQPYVALAAGMVHVCGLLSNGTVVCLGDNTSGQLGTLSPWPKSDPPWTATPSPVYGEGAYVALSAQANGTCALLANGSAHCWVSPTRQSAGLCTTSNA